MRLFSLQTGMNSRLRHCAGTRFDAGTRIPSRSGTRGESLPLATRKLCREGIHGTAKVGRVKIPRLRFGLVVLLLASPVQAEQIPLRDLLNPDGTLTLSDDFSGQIDSFGWDLVLGEGGAPRFVRAKSHKGPDPNDAWSAQFGLVGADASDVTAIAKSGSDVYFGGEFHFELGSGRIAQAIVRWDGTRWSTVGSGIRHSSGISEVRAMAFDGNGLLYVGGEFEIVGGDFTVPNAGIAANNVATWNPGTQMWGALVDTGGNNGVNREVNAITTMGTDAYIGGRFSQTGKGPTSFGGVGKWNPGTMTWDNLGGGVDALVPVVNALALDAAGNLYLGGTFTDVGGVPANNIALWNGIAWSALGAGLTLDPSGGAVHVIAVKGGDVLVGGKFAISGAVPIRNLAIFTGGTFAEFGGGAEGTEVLAIEPAENGVLVGGRVTTFDPDGQALQIGGLGLFKDNNWEAIGNAVTGGPLFNPPGGRVTSIVSEGDKHLYWRHEHLYRKPRLPLRRSRALERRALGCYGAGPERGF